MRIRNRLIGYAVKQNRIVIRFNLWRELHLDGITEAHERNQARLLRLKHLFYRLRYGAKQFKDEVGASIQMAVMRREFWEHNSKRRGI